MHRRTCNVRMKRPPPLEGFARLHPTQQSQPSGGSREPCCGVQSWAASRPAEDQFEKQSARTTFSTQNLCNRIALERRRQQVELERARNRGRQIARCPVGQVSSRYRGSQRQIGCRGRTLRRCAEVWIQRACSGEMLRRLLEVARVELLQATTVRQQSLQILGRAPLYGFTLRNGERDAQRFVQAQCDPFLQIEQTIERVAFQHRRTTRSVAGSLDRGNRSLDRELIVLLRN